MKLFIIREEDMPEEKEVIKLLYGNVTNIENIGYNQALSDLRSKAREVGVDDVIEILKKLSEDRKQIRAGVMSRCPYPSSGVERVYKYNEGLLALATALLKELGG
jgi:hypothetical protein